MSDMGLRHIRSSLAHDDGLEMKHRCHVPGKMRRVTHYLGRASHISCSDSSLKLTHHRNPFFKRDKYIPKLQDLTSVYISSICLCLINVEPAIITQFKIESIPKCTCNLHVGQFSTQHIWL